MPAYLGIKIEQPASTVGLDDIILNKCKTLREKKNTAVRLAAELISDVYLKKRAGLKIKREGKNIVALLGGYAAIIPKGEEDMHDSIIAMLPPKLENYLDGATIMFSYGALPGEGEEVYQDTAEIGDILVLQPEE